MAICTQELLLWDDLGRNHRMSNVDMGQTNEARFSVHVGTHVSQMVDDIHEG